MFPQPCLDLRGAVAIDSAHAQVWEAAALLKLDPAARNGQMICELLLSDPPLRWLWPRCVRGVERAYASDARSLDDLSIQVHCALRRLAACRAGYVS